MSHKTFIFLVGILPFPTRLRTFWMEPVKENHPASDYTAPTHYVKYCDSIIIVFEIMHLFARLPPKGWLDRILVGGATSGCQQGGGRGRKRKNSAAGQTRLLKFPSSNYVAL